jgi:hypothetical protein
LLLEVAGFDICHFTRSCSLFPHGPIVICQLKLTAKLFDPDGQGVLLLLLSFQFFLGCAKRRSPIDMDLPLRLYTNLPIVAVLSFPTQPIYDS